MKFAIYILGFNALIWLVLWLIVSLIKAPMWNEENDEI